jgi:ubiquinone biosynthesis protein UbiJ
VDARIAADVNVTFVNHLEGLPADANDFLGSVLGVNGRSFIHVLERAHELSDFEKFSAAIDALARRYVAEFIGKGFDKLRGSAEFTAFLNRVHAVIASYETLEERAITLFDKYFDELGVLTEFLDRIAGLQESQLQQLRSRLTPLLWTML